MNPRVSRMQGAYYLVTGIWPLLDRRSFEALSGRKQDFWLARTVGVITAAVGLSLELAGRHKRASSEIAVLGLGTAVGFAAIDLTYALRRRISGVYLLDGLLQGLIIAGHLTDRGGGRDAGPRSSVAQSRAGAFDDTWSSAPGRLERQSRRDLVIEETRPAEAN